ncbi:hypothetical protein BC832DRAFT_541745 [Gaertneriomyces semiglobifer]|nr:hypothetical protein BC832DRAFT_541745 [Gaertneriomyces semiglobifer]
MERINFSTQTEPPLEMRRDTIVRDFTTQTNQRSSVERSTSPAENRFVTAPRPHVPSTPPEPMQVSPPPRQRSAPMTSVASSRSSGTVTTTQSMFNERTPIAPATNERKRRASTELERTRTRPYTSTPISLTQPVQSASVETSGGTPVVPAMVGNGVITTPIVAEREVRRSTRSTRPPERYSPSVPTVTVAAPITHSPAPTAPVPLRRSNRANKGSSVAPPASPVQPTRSTRAKKAPERYSPGDPKVTASVQEVSAEAPTSAPDASSSIGAPKEEKKKRPMTEKQKAALQKAQAAREQDEQKRIQEAKELLQKHKDYLKKEREAKKLAKESNKQMKEKKVPPAVQVEVPQPSKLVGRIEEEEPRPGHVFAVFDDDNPYSVIFGRRHGH